VTTLMVRCRVADYDAWRPQYDAAMERARGVVRSYRVWRSQDDPNLVFTEETLDSREVAEALLANPAIQQEMKEHGVDPPSVQIDLTRSARQRTEAVRASDPAERTPKPQERGSSVRCCSARNAAPDRGRNHAGAVAPPGTERAVAFA
jgi:hypothetical protein